MNLAENCRFTELTRMSGHVAAVFNQRISKFLLSKKYHSGHNINYHKTSDNHIRHRRAEI